MQSSISWGMMKGRVWVVFNQVTITKRWTEKLFGETSWKHPAFILVERSEGANSVWNFEAGLHEVYQIQRSLSSHRKHKKISAQNTFQIPGNGISKAYLLHRIRKNTFLFAFFVNFYTLFQIFDFPGGSSAVVFVIFAFFEGLCENKNNKLQSPLFRSPLAINTKFSQGSLVNRRAGIKHWNRLGRQAVPFTNIITDIEPREEFCSSCGY